MLVAHISDLHLGRKSPGDLQGAERLNSFRQAICTLARSQPDAVVIAGDTFDSPQAEQAIIEEAAKTLCGARNAAGDAIPVVLIPGNHDPADAERLWTAFEESLASSADVHLVRQARVIELAGGKLLVEAYPCLTRFSAEPPWETRLPVVQKNSNAVRVVVAHGTLLGGPVPEGEADAYPFTQPEVESLGADYVALGHFHGLYPAWGNGDECQRGCCYSGTHEPDQFGGDAGYAILASLNAGQPTQLKRIKIGRRQWRLIPLARPADLDQVQELLEETRVGNDPGRHVIRLKVGSDVGWTADEVDRLEGLEGALRALGAHVERRGDIRACVDVQTLDLPGLPSGAVKEALLSLRRDLEQCDAPNGREVFAAALQVGWEKLQEFTQP
jgi:DNA repair exonuclease SbcCD nuclease subunit